MTPQPAQQRTVRFRGEVQGVGFRATTARFAAEFAVTGRVRNLSDGCVELIAEGSPAEIDRLVHRLQGHFGPKTHDTTTVTAAATEAYSGFSVRY